MASDHSGPADDHALAVARTVNDACERFETAWKRDDQPRIARYLEVAEPFARDALFEELLALEIELRRDRGDAPIAADYLGEFPARRAVIERTFADAETAALPGHAVPPGLSADRGADRTTVAWRSAPRADGQPLLSGSTIGAYELIEEIARGGMGVVYRARDQRLKRFVALKMIRSGAMATGQERERFLREAELAANLDHPNIVPIHEVGEWDGLPYFSMKLIEGTSLSQQIPRLGNDPRGAARLVASLARAVDYAHQCGFLHCDLKPANVLLDREDKPFLTDFGLARRAGESSTFSISGAILGTPSYMAPEQATGGERAGLGAATDVYGLGAILYELLAGRPPFRAATIMETVVQVLERDPLPPSEARPKVPGELEGICLKCLEKAPKDRYPSARKLADDLEGFLRGDGVAAAGPIARLRRWNRREPELTSRIGGLGLMAVITQINYFLSPAPDSRLHWTVQAVLGLWAVLSALFQALSRRGLRPGVVRLLWTAVDVVCLTIEIKLLEHVEISPAGAGPLARVETTLLVGYPLLIAASGLWWRAGLVWTTTALTTAAYLWLYLDAALWWRDGRSAWRPSPDFLHPNIFLAGLFLTGFVVVRQVNRILALGRYYENRADP